MDLSVETSTAAAGQLELPTGQLDLPAGLTVVAVKSLPVRQAVSVSSVILKPRIEQGTSIHR